MIDHGHAVLYGDLAEIKARYRRNSVIIECEGELGDIPGVTQRSGRQGTVELQLESGTTPGQVLKKLGELPVDINRFEVSTPSLNEIFLKVVGTDD